MSDNETPIPPTIDGVAARMSKKERREERRRAAREAAALEEEEANEPDPEPIVCAWCGFSAFFDDDATEGEKEKCPACACRYLDPPAGYDISVTDGVRSEMRDAVHRRIATALDNLFALMSEQWEAAQQAAEEAADRRAAYR